MQPGGIKVHKAKAIEKHAPNLLCVIIASYAYRVFDGQLLLVSYSHYHHWNIIFYVIKVIL